MDHIRGLLFDKDGTLFDFQTTWGVWTASLLLDLTGGDETRAGRLALTLGYDMRAQRFHKDSVIISHTADEVARAIGNVVPGWDRAELLAHVNQTAAQVPQVPPVPLVPLFEGLRGRGLRLGIATNDAEAPARAHLARAGVIHLFDFIAGYDSGFGAKPETGMQRAFCEATGLAAQDVLMVGDSAHDLVSGRAAGMGTIGVLTGVLDRDELAPYCDVVLDHIGEIPGWLWAD
ncbi:MAG: HAD family hydrolase [Alphaproteobacteria bacterium]|nr:HAD family hydrolase [Alphaproteobacteria bacterium]